MEWFRFYHEALDDLKVQALPPATFKHWVNLLCLANQGNPRGSLPALSVIAFRLRLSEAKAAALLTDLEARGLIDSNVTGNVTPHNWDTRQRKSDNVAERVAKHRGNVTCNVTHPLAVTPPDTDTDTESETEQNRAEKTTPHAPQGEPPKQAKPRTDKQKAADELYERKMIIVSAYFRGLAIEEGTLPWTQRKGSALGALTSAVLNSPECVPEIVEPLTRYTAAAFQWRNGKKTPALNEVLMAFAEWDQAGRPDGAPNKPTNSRASPPPNNLNGVFDRLRRERGEAPRDDPDVIEAGYQVGARA